MAEEGAWPSIKKYGLLSTSALLDLYGIKGQERERIERCCRSESVTIRHDKYGTAIIRDNKPMSEIALQKCLTGMTLTGWFRLLNGKVFFWLTAERVSRLLCARAYRNREHTVLAIDTTRLLAKHGADVTLSPINSGSELPFTIEGSTIELEEAIRHPDTLLIFPICWQACLFGSLGRFDVETDEFGVEDMRTTRRKYRAWAKFFHTVPCAIR